MFPFIYIIACFFLKKNTIRFLADQRSIKAHHSPISLMQIVSARPPEERRAQSSAAPASTTVHRFHFPQDDGRPRPAAPRSHAGDVRAAKLAGLGGGWCGFSCSRLGWACPRRVKLAVFSFLYLKN